VVDVAGLASMVSVVEPVLHINVVAPLAVSIIESPGQIPGLGGVMVNVGVGVTFTVNVALLIHPAPLVPVTV
jgi:hypothetical protein